MGSRAVASCCCSCGSVSAAPVLPTVADAPQKNGRSTFCASHYSAMPNRYRGRNIKGRDLSENGPLLPHPAIGQEILSKSKVLFLTSAIVPKPLNQARGHCMV